MNVDKTIPSFLAPFSEDAFRSKYLDKAVLVINRKNPMHFCEVVSLAHIDELVTSVRMPPTNLNLARGDAPIPLEAYCRGGAYVDKRSVLSLHDQGATIILRSVEQWSAKLNRLRIAAESFFGVECQINVYITPPGEKSTPPHWDTHDLIVLQIAGSKTWRLYDGKRTLPLAEERFRVGEDYVSAKFKEVVLRPGDTLYVPRGVIHEPVAQTYSVHLSIGINTVRWYDVLSLALRLLAEEEGSSLRSAIPTVEKFDVPSPAVHAVSRLTDSDVVTKAINMLRSSFQAGRAIELQGIMLDIGRMPEVTASTAVASELV